MEINRVIQICKDIEPGQPFTLVYQDEAPFLKVPARKAGLSGIMTKTATNVKLGHGLKTMEAIKQARREERELDQHYLEHPEDMPDGYVYIKDRPHVQRNFTAVWEPGISHDYYMSHAEELTDYSDDMESGSKYVSYGLKNYLMINADKEDDQHWKSEYDISLNGVDMHLDSLSGFEWALSKAQSKEEKPWRDYIPIAFEKIVSINGQS